MCVYVGVCMCVAICMCACVSVCACMKPLLKPLATGTSLYGIQAQSEPNKKGDKPLLSLNMVVLNSRNQYENHGF